MKLSGKQLLSSIALILILTVSGIMASLPAASAHAPAWNTQTYCYVTASPNPVGVNQPVILIMWVNSYPPTANGNYGDRWHNFIVTITAPDGTTQTLGPYTSDPIGSTYTNWIPTQAGTYKLVFSWPGATLTGLPINPIAPVQYNAAYVNDTFSSATSNPFYLTVTQVPQPSWQESPLPTGYWTVPVNGQNRNWAPIIANWLAGAAQTNGPTTAFGYGVAPESAHVLWTRPMWEGGIMDTRFGVTTYRTYDYEGLGLSPPVILNGVLYYVVQSLPREGWYAVDLYTGKTLYFHNTTGPVVGIGGGFDYTGYTPGEILNFAQIYNYNSPNQEGGLGYLWSTGATGAAGPFSPYISTTWAMFDGFTGNYICSIGNVTTIESRGARTITTGATGSNIYGIDGSILYYNIVNLGATTPAYYLQVWNTSRAIWYNTLALSASGAAANAYWMWRPTLNYTFDGNNGYSLNASIPAVQGTIRAVRENNQIIGGIGATYDTNGNVIVPGNLWALSLKQASDGTINPALLWNITFTPPSQLGNVTWTLGTVDPEDGVFTFSCAQTMQRAVYSLSTGQLLWTSQPEPAFNYYGMTQQIYQGKLFGYGYGGQLIAYNITTGNILWTYNDTQVAGGGSVYGGNYPIGVGLIADGKIYLGSGEHSPTQPLWRGASIISIDATTGKELWKLWLYGVSMPSGNGGSNYALGDGYLVALNAYDMQIYCFGKGPSATTVTTQDTVAPLGSSVLIQGTVTDQSPGAKGTPAISDADQQAWMQYLYEQQAIPAQVTGVPVTLSAIDPNGNPQNIGTVTSDMTGNFKMIWTPQISGAYSIIASFAGSKSYGGSYAETSLGVGPKAASPASVGYTTATNSHTTTDNNANTLTAGNSNSSSSAKQPQRTDNLHSHRRSSDHHSSCSSSLSAQKTKIDPE